MFIICHACRLRHIRFCGIITGLSKKKILVLIDGFNYYHKLTLYLKSIKFLGYIKIGKSKKALVIRAFLIIYIYNSSVIIPPEPLSISRLNGLSFSSKYVFTAPRSSIFSVRLPFSSY